MSVQSCRVRFSARLAALTSCAALFACGCGLANGGLGDTVEADGGGGIPGSQDATAAEFVDGTVNVGDDAAPSKDATTATSDAPNGDDAAPVEAGSDSCASNVEVCNNGIDDNCNGLVDCADPECGPAKWQCTTQAVPAGWTVVEYVSSSAPPAGCDTSYASSSTVYEGPFSTTTCPCECTVGTAGSCDNGSFGVILSNPSQKCPGPATNYPAGGGACEPTTPPGYTPGAGAKQQITPVPYTPGTCQPAGGTPTPPPVPANGHVCAEAVPSGAGCANNGACVPAVQSGYSLCIEKASPGGAIACPPGFGNVHDVGNSITDSRTCSTCECGTPTGQCNGAMVTLFTGAQCDGGTATVQANGACDDVTVSTTATNPTFAAYEYSASVANELCGQGASTASGSVALTNPSTICCQ